MGELGGGDRDVRVCDFREDLKACASMKSKVSCRDFVNKLYEEKCKSLDMKRVDEICDEFGKIVQENYKCLRMLMERKKMMLKMENV